ncbi:MAG: four helix bundle protein [Blastocatellia bacterium]|nr:four helix bundle protein [Blastocatellia bacterium]
MDAGILKQRTKNFALRIIKLVESLPPGRTSDVVGRQLVKSGTSVGANYRAACRAKSRADFIAKMAIVEEEADESIFWIEVLIESGLLRRELVQNLMEEADQLVSIFVASINTARGRKRGRSEK